MEKIVLDCLQEILSAAQSIEKAVGKVVGWEVGKAQWGSQREEWHSPPTCTGNGFQEIVSKPAIVGKTVATITTTLREKSGMGTKANKKSAKRIAAVCLLMLFAVACLGLLSGCQTTNKSDAFMNTPTSANSRFFYQPSSNQTGIEWQTTLTNGTIYNFDQFSITFELYHQSSLLSTTTFYYDVSVKHGGEYTGSFYFNVEGEVDSLEFVSWTANYRSLWDTYKVWFIVMFVLVGVGVALYIAVILIGDYELDDVISGIAEFLGDHVWVSFLFLLFIAGIIWGLAVSYWVPVLIVLGGIVSFFILALLTHLTRFVICAIIDNVDFASIFQPRIRLPKKIAGGEDVPPDDEEKIEEPNPEISAIASCADDEAALAQFTAKQLKEYCKSIGLKGFSLRTKAELIELIAKQSILKARTKNDKGFRQSASGENEPSSLDDDGVPIMEEAGKRTEEPIFPISPRR